MLSAVVVTYDMARELPRTLRSLAPSCQRGIDADDYEIIVVDNGSPVPVDAGMLADLPGHIRVERIDPAPASPAHAANVGIGLAQGDLIGMFIDGARMASPGLLAMALLASRLHPRPVIASLGWHLGAVTHMQAAAEGYDQLVEDELLRERSWADDPYVLFEISTFAGSSRGGWFAPLSESNGMFLPRSMWEELGGLDEHFSMPGGGLVNLDLYRRACGLTGAQLITILGEGTFHQIHGGAATSRVVPMEGMKAEYEALRGEPFRPPENRSLYVGTMPDQALAHLERSARMANKERGPGPLTPRA